MSWELNPQKRHHRVADLIVDYHIGDVEEHRALSDAIQEQMLYQALCAEPPGEGSGMKGKTDMVASSGRRRVEMSIVTDEAEDYANSQDYDCCQIIEGAFTVGDAIIERTPPDDSRLPPTPESKQPPISSPLI